jgi:hypothetical protein
MRLRGSEERGKEEGRGWKWEKEEGEMVRVMDGGVKW